MRRIVSDLIWTCRKCNRSGRVTWDNTGTPAIALVRAAHAHVSAECQFDDRCMFLARAAGKEVAT